MKCCNQKKGVERKIFYARVTHSKNTTLGNLNTINSNKLHSKTTNLVQLNYRNKVQCSMCQLPTNKHIVIFP
jgi:hypothetical protein